MGAEPPTSGKARWALVAAGALGICCGGSLLVALGVGSLLGVLISPWFLVPAAAVLSGGLWYYRRRPICAKPEAGAVVGEGRRQRLGK